MMEDNEHLLQQFFNKAAQQQLKDEGFTERVMRQLPARKNWFGRLWTPFCIITFVILFVVFRGWKLLFIHLEGLLQSIASQPFTSNMQMMLVVFFGLLIVGTCEVISRSADSQF